ncbi:MAG TPA: sigma-70 family RNA polymerase sigma factor [Candidatus Eisenbacteria bacterium]
MPRQEERALLEAARSGDRRALRRLLDRMSRPIYRFGRDFCRNPEDAEDVMQEVLASLVRSLPSLRGDASLTTWAYTVARNACIRQRRRFGRAVVSLEGAAGGSSDGHRAPVRFAEGVLDPERELLRSEVETALRTGLASLPAAQRDAVLLRDVEGLPLGEVARVLRVGPRAAKARIHRGRAALRHALARLLREEDAVHPRPRGCPDVARLLSGYLEGDLDASRCADLAAHVARCPSCGRECRALRRSLGACRRYGRRGLPARVRDRLRRSIAAVLSGTDNSL